MGRPFLNAHQRKLKAAYIGMLQDMPKETTYAITLQTHSKDIKGLPETIDARRQYFDRLLSIWDRKLCREFIGPNYHRNSKRTERQSGFAFPEKFDESPHYHLIIDIKKWDPEAYKTLAEEFWIELWEPATVDIQQRYKSKWEGYLMKDWNPLDAYSWIPIPYVQK